MSGRAWSKARYAIALDPSGKLPWESGALDGEHAVTVLSEQVSDAYLAFLQTRGVSYLFGGKRELDWAACSRSSTPA